MRINRLEIAGFGPYKETQTVDFDAFTDDGIFLISGKTGAGKSSILDAICFALYDAVPRYDGTQTQLRSHHAELEDPSFVALEFTTGSLKYRVHRTPEYERPAKRGGGTTKQLPEALLSVWRNDQWEGLAAKPREVGHELNRILGLSKDQFLQVILLAQNRFQEFLLAKSDERQEVLQALFGTERFAAYEKAIVERSKALAGLLGSAVLQREQDAARAADLADVEPGLTLEWFTAGLESLTAQLDAATLAVASAKTAHDTAQAAHTALIDTRTQQGRRDVARASLATLESERPAITRAREDSDRAVRAESVVPLITAHLSATSLLATALSSEDSARGAYGDPDATVETLEAVIDERSRELGALEEAIADELSLPALEAELVAAVGLIADLDSSVASGAARAAELPALITRTADQLTAARVEAGRLADAKAAVERLSAQHFAAVAAETAGEKLALGRAAELAASEAHTAASTRLQELLRRRLHGYAGFLATELVDGEPCTVCGSTAHPAPAVAEADSVSEEDIELARTQLDSLKTALDLTSSTAAELSAAHLAATAASGGKLAEQVQGALDEATVALGLATGATTRVEMLEGVITALLAEQEESTAVAASLQAHKQEAEVTRASVADRVAALTQRLAKSRGEFASVSERATSIRAVVAAAKALTAAIATRISAEAAATAANEALSAQLIEQAFETAVAASSSRLSAEKRQRLNQQILAHERGLAVATTTLAEPALLELPDDLVQLDAAAEASELTRRELAELTGTRGSIAEKHAQYVALLGVVTERFAATAQLTAEFEQVESLALAVEGKGSNTRKMRLETYVLAARLEEIVAAANGRLRTMTAGRYELQHDDSVAYRKAQSGLGLAILDQHTGRARATHSLSGGETFLASLALALGLAEVVTNQSGGITLDTLFVDEGFGSLDGDTLEIAMSTLDSLREGGRTIGLISHVDAMKEQIHAKLGIRVTDGGWSEIVQA